MNGKYERAMSLYHNGYKDQAIKILDELVMDEPNNVDAWFYLAISSYDLSEKIYSLKRVLKLNPDHREARDMLNKINNEGLFQNQSQPEKSPEPVINSQQPLQQYSYPSSISQNNSNSGLKASIDPLIEKPYSLLALLFSLKGRICRSTYWLCSFIIAFTFVPTGYAYSGENGQ